MEFIDTHSHMYLPQFSEDVEEAVERALQNGINTIVLPNIDLQTLDLVDEMCDAFSPTCIPLLGLHPTHVKENFESELGSLFKRFESRTYVGIGEIGIDLYWDKTFLEEQKVAFEKQVRFAIEKKLPFVIHARDSFNEIFEVLEKINEASYTGIFHAFTGTKEQAQQIIEMGFILGIGGILTFKNSGLSETVSSIDLKHIVLETDSPYLAPVPYRGKRNESSYIPLIAKHLSDLKNKSLEEVAKITTANAKVVFKL